MCLFVQALLNGVLFGSVYTLLAVGLSMVFSIMRIINFAHGELYMVGSYMTWFFITRIVDNYWLGGLFSVAIGSLLGFIVERLFFRSTYEKPPLNQFCVAIGLIILLQEGMLVLFGGSSQQVTNIYPTVRHLGNIYITDQRILVIGITLVLLVAIFLFFQRARMGMAMRAAAGNKLAASMVGININRMGSLSFIGSVILAAVAGALLAPLFVTYPFMGSRLTGIAFVVIVVGGMGSIGGAIIAGYAIGIIESLSCAYISVEWSFITSFIILILVLMFRPMGLFGKERAA